MAISKTARKSGATERKTSRGPARVNQKYKKGHRARKPRPERPLDVAKPNNHAVRHEAKKLALLDAATRPEAFVKEVFGGIVSALETL